MGLGKAVNVYIRTINTVNEEYLVDFEILDNELSKYGIYPAPKETLNMLGLSKPKIDFKDIPSEKRFKEGGKTFKDIYNQMNDV